MPSRSLQALFLRARDQHESTGKKAFLAVLALLFTHAAVVTPLVEQERQRVTAAAEERLLVALVNEVAALDPLLDVEPPLRVLQLALDELVAGVSRDLARLDAGRRQLAQADEPSPEDLPAKADPTAAADPTPAEAEPFAIGNPEWAAAIREADNRYSLLAALEPVVSKLVIEPRLAAANEVWKSQALPPLQARLEQAAQALPGLRDRSPQAAEGWGAFDGALTGLRHSARDLVVKPPDQPYWWASPEDAPVFALGLTAAVAEQLRAPVALDELKVAAGNARERYDALRGGLWNELEQTQRMIERRRQQLAGFGELLGKLGLDVYAAATLFPLLLGLALAAVLVRRNQRLRELGLTTSLMTADGGPPPLRAWCLAQLGGPPARADTAGDAEAAWRSGWLRALGVLALTLTWIALAALQVRGMRGLDPERWMALSVAAAAAVLVATLHRLIVARRLVVQLESVEAARDGVAGAAPPADPAVDGEEPELLLGHTLRR